MHPVLVAASLFAGTISGTDAETVAGKELYAAGTIAGLFEPLPDKVIDEETDRQGACGDCLVNTKASTKGDHCLKLE